ncbi:MAG: hypothetical protein QOI06_2777 [Nocardioidaceae bacterium]|nr:hypothetical protein [Nocardioidaceae bacterium]
MRSWSRPRLVVAAIIPLAVAGVTAGVSSASPGATTSTATFTNFEPAGLKTFGLDEGGGSVGTRCPGAGPSKCYNTAGEPAIRADEQGNFYAASENGLGAGTEAWKSTDGGRHYVTLPSPDAASTGNDSGVAPGGGDVDVAVGDDTNSTGFVPLHISSLNLANVDVSNSQDGGSTFMLQPAAAKMVGDDREWIAADDSHQSPLQLPVEGGDKVCISYHDTVQNISVDCDYNGGLAFPQHSSAIDTSHAPYLVGNNEIGNLAIARDTIEGDATKGNHNLYQIFSGPQNIAGDTACGTAGTCYNVVYMGVSTDGGVTFTDHIVHLDPNINVSYGHQFTNVSVDRKGNVYAVYCDNHNIYYSYSTNQGSTWSSPTRINKTPANTAIFPWSVAGNDGALDVVYYGTSHSPAPGETPDNYPMSAAWHVYFAQNLHASTAGSVFSQVAASPVNHYGGVCESGVGCTGNRDLYDDFGVAASPTTGLASIVYTDDQYRANNTNNPHAPGCTASTTNTGSCVHTAFATQLTGTGIY